ncbi:hypothetical protein ScPMuIL_007882 [Solemya velum]
MKPTAGQLWRVKASSEGICAIKCTKDKKCVSFFYGQNEGNGASCVGYADITDMAALCLDYAEGWNFFPGPLKADSSYNRPRGDEEEDLAVNPATENTIGDEVEAMNNKTAQCSNGSVYVQATPSGLGTTWNEAMEACKTINSKLVEIETEEEENCIYETFSANRGIRGFWIGATREKGTWRWATSDRKIEYTNWGIGSPRPHHTCAALYIFFESTWWHGRECKEEMPAVCEKRIIE